MWKSTVCYLKLETCYSVCHREYFVALLLCNVKLSQAIVGGVCFWNSFAEGRPGGLMGKAPLPGFAQTVVACWTLSLSLSNTQYFIFVSHDVILQVQWNNSNIKWDRMHVSFLTTHVTCYLSCSGIETWESQFRGWQGTICRTVRTCICHRVTVLAVWQQNLSVSPLPSGTSSRFQVCASWLSYH